MSNKVAVYTQHAWACLICISIVIMAAVASASVAGSIVGYRSIVDVTPGALVASVAAYCFWNVRRVDAATEAVARNKV